MSNTIKITAPSVFGEALAREIIKPGHLIELISTGKLQKHEGHGSVAEKMFAIEDELQGNGTTDAYAVDALVQYGIWRSGDVVNARMAVSQTIVIGDKLISAGGGQLKEIASDSSAGSETSQYPIAVALEAYSGAADGFCLVRII